MRRTGGFAGTRIAAALVQALTVVVVARELDPTRFAVFAVLFGSLQFAQAFFDGGCTQAVARHHAQRPEVVGILRYGRLLAGVATVLCTALIAAAAAVTGDTVLVSLVPLGVWVALERQAEMTQMFLVAWNRTGSVAVAVLARRLLVLFACLVVPVLVPGTVTWAFALSSVLGSGLAWFGLARAAAAVVAELPGDPADTPPRRRDCAARLLPYWLTGLGLQLRQLDLTVLAAVTGVGVTAAFAPASRLIPPLRIVPTTYAQVLLAQLSREGRALRGRELWLPCLGTAVAAVAGVVAAAPLLPLALGAGYAVAVLPLQIALVALVPATAASVLTTAVQTRGRNSYAATCAWVSAVIGLGLVALLGVVAGAPGAATATGLGFVVQAALLARVVFGRDRGGPAAVRTPVTATSLLAQYENLGDLVIRREAVAIAAADGRVSLLADHATPRWWCTAVAAPAAEVTTLPRPAWLARVLGLRAGDTLVHHGGAFPLRRRDLPREVALLLLAGWLRWRGVAIVRLPRSVGGDVSRLTARVHRLVAGAATVDLWRDHRSHALVGSGVVAPDLAVRGGPDWTPGPRPLLVVSMRGDRPEEADEAVGLVADLAARHGLRPVVVSQVERDNATALDVADRLGCDVQPWTPTASARLEPVLADLYRRAEVVVSNRLHVVLLAALRGALPVCPAPGPNPKVVGACEVVGIALGSADDPGCGLPAGRDALDARRAALRDGLLGASVRLGRALEPLGAPPGAPATADVPGPRHRIDDGSRPARHRTPSTDPAGTPAPAGTTTGGR